MAQTKKLTNKQIAKNEIKVAIRNFFRGGDFDIIDCGETPYPGYTKDTLILRGYTVHEKNYDVQIKIIAPKAGLDQYELEDEY